MYVHFFETRQPPMLRQIYIAVTLKKYLLELYQVKGFICGFASP